MPLRCTTARKNNGKKYVFCTGTDDRHLAKTKSGRRVKPPKRYAYA
jgi:hypothetical protein